MSVPGISKHDLIYLSYRMKCPKYTPKIFKYREYKNFNSEAFTSDGLSVPWHLINQENCVDRKVNTFTRLLTELLNRHIPIRTARATRPPRSLVNGGNTYVNETERCRLQCIS